jgi:hypothetical protein
MSRYRIIHVETGGIDPCCWQAQKRVWLFFWRNLCGRTASATTQGNEILKDIHRAAGGQDE